VLRLFRWLAGPILLLLLLLALFWPPPAWGLPAAEVSGNQGSGAGLFESHCAGCHIHGGNIIRRGRTLKLKALERNGIATPEAIARIAADGIGRMGGYGSVLGEGGPEVVAQWVWQQAVAGWPES
jgi:cytochrome c6